MPLPCGAPPTADRSRLRLLIARGGQRACWSHQPEEHGKRAIDGNEGRVVYAADHRTDPLAARRLCLVDLDLRRPLQTGRNPAARSFSRRRATRSVRDIGLGMLTSRRYM